MQAPIAEAYELLRGAGIVSSESEFSQDWLGHSECYFRTLRFKKSLPSLGSIAICASRMQKAGEQMLSTIRYRHLGRTLIEMSERCHQSVNERSVEFDLAN